VIVLAGITACGYIPRPVEGVPPGAPWEALPLRKWLAEDRTEPQAIAFCAPPECRPGLVVGVVELNGRDADITETVLRDPARLAKAMMAQGEPGAKIRGVASTKPIQGTAFHGFSIRLAPSAGNRPPAFGAALGRRFAQALKIVLVIGDDETAVLDTARRVAARELTQ
jgi:hypothetical protein